MAESVREAEVAEVDAFLAGAKSLRGGVPLWEPTGWKSELGALWVVEDEHGIARAQGA